MTITANDHPTKVVITDEGAPYANDHPFKVEIEGGGDFATKEDIEELNEKIAALATDLSYKGGVPTYAALPSDPEQGDVYTTDDTGILWVWDGIKWVPLNENQETILGTDAPTTSTKGEVGQLYLNTTTGKVYILQTIDTSTTPATYTWIAVGPTVVQTTGTSTTDVMSQNAVTGMVYNNNNTRRIVIGGTINSAMGVGVIIGGEASVSGTTGFRNTVIIGDSSTSSNSGNNVVVGSSNSASNAHNSVLIGYNGNTNSNGEISIGYKTFDLGGDHGKGAISLGAYSAAHNTGEMNIGSTDTSYGYNNSAYRLLSGVYDGQSAHDAATVGQIGSTISDQDFATLLNGTGA